jgi:alpha-mannosidase
MERTYSLCPHSGTLATSDTVKLAYDLNYPMVAVKATPDKSLLPESFSLVSINKDNVICETVKEAENSLDTVVRVYESKNTRTKATVTVGFDFKKCYLCDLLENELCELEATDGKVTFDIGGFEITTLKFKH